MEGGTAAAEAYLLAALRLRAEAVLAEEGGKLATSALLHAGAAQALERWLTALPAKLSSTRFISLCLVAADARGDANRLHALLGAKKPLQPLPGGLEATVAPLGAPLDASVAFEVTLANKIARMHLPPAVGLSSPAVPALAAEAVLEPLAGIELLGRALRVGAFLSPTVFAPADIWRQHNARIPGFNLKREGFLALLQGLRRFSAVTAARTECPPVDVFMRELAMLLAVLDKLKAAMQPLHDERQREAAARVRQRLERAAAASAAKATDIASRARGGFRGSSGSNNGVGGSSSGVAGVASGVASRVGSVAWAISQGVRGGTFGGGVADGTAAGPAAGAGGLPPRQPSLSGAGAPSAISSDADPLVDSPLVLPSPTPGGEAPAVLALFSDAAPGGEGGGDGASGGVEEGDDSGVAAGSSRRGLPQTPLDDGAEEEDELDLGVGSMDVWGGGGGSGSSIGGAATPARARGVSGGVAAGSSASSGGPPSETASPASIRGRLGTELGFGDDVASLDGGDEEDGDEDGARRRRASTASSVGDAGLALPVAPQAAPVAASSASSSGGFGALTSAPAPAAAAAASGGKGSRLFSALKAKALGVVASATAAPAPSPAAAAASSSSSSSGGGFSLLKRAQVAIKGVAASAAQALNLSSSAAVTVSTSELVAYALMLSEICDLISQLQAWVRASLWGQALVLGQVVHGGSGGAGEARGDDPAEIAAYERWLHSCAAVWMVSHVRASVLRVVAGLWSNFGSLALSDLGLLLNRHLAAHHEKIVKVKAQM